MALPSYLEDTAKDFAKQSVATYSAPIETSTFTGGLDASGKRAAGPGITGANPFVAQMDPLQTQAQGLAQAGIGSYSPFLQAAQTNIANQANLTGPNAYKDFMSPYQQQAQANLTANQQAAKTAAYEPYGRLNQYGQGLTGLAGGVASAYAEPAPVQSPLSQALSTALGVGGIYSRLYGKGFG